MTNTIKLINLFSNIEAAYADTVVSIRAEYTAPEFCPDENVTMPGCLDVVACHADGATELLYTVDTDEYGDFNFTATLHMANPGTMHFVYTNNWTGVVDEFDDLVDAPVDDPFDKPVAGFDSPDYDFLPF